MLRVVREDQLTVDALRTTFRTRDRTEFLREFDCPFLVQETEPEEAPQPKTPPFGTLVSVTRATAFKGDERPVFPVRKAASRNPFGLMVTIGRAPNNDIILPYETVSKFHAYLWKTEREPWTLCDAGSSNGTTLEGTPLVPRVKVSLVLAEDHALAVTFGTHAKFLFATPQTLWALLALERG